MSTYLNRASPAAGQRWLQQLVNRVQLFWQPWGEPQLRQAGTRKQQGKTREIHAYVKPNTDFTAASTWWKQCSLWPVCVFWRSGLWFACPCSVLLWKNLLPQPDPGGMTLTFRWQFRVLGLQLQHMLNAQTALITTISAIYFQAILSTCSIFHWVQSSWSPKSGSLSFLSWIFSDSHSHRRPDTPDLATLTVWFWVVIPGQKRDLKWSRADEGQKLAQGRQRDEQQAWWQWRWGQLDERWGRKAV